MPYKKHSAARSQAGRRFRPAGATNVPAKGELQAREKIYDSVENRPQ
jgi:hypothetical protein